jgi:integrase
LSLSILKAHAAAVAALQRGVALPPLPDRPIANRRRLGGRAPKITDFGEAYLADRVDLAAKTKLQARLSFRLLADHCDDCAFDAIDRTTASSWVNKLVKSGLASATINRHLSTISKAFKWGLNQGKIAEDTRSPWSGLWRTAPRDDDGEIADNGWEAYDDRELRALFKGQRLVKQPSRFSECLPWIMTIALYSGMRLSEICGLRGGDVRREHGVLVMDVRRSKTRAGKRLVPVHPHLVKLGLPAIVKSAGKDLLFPKANANYTARRFTLFRRKQGCARDGLSFHSLRKNFVTAAEDAGVPDTTIAALVGHKGRRGFTLSKYAPKPRLRLLAAAVAKVDYKGLKL